MFSFATRHQLVRDGNPCPLPAFSTVYLEPGACPVLAVIVSEFISKSVLLWPPGTVSCSHPSPLSLMFLPLPP